MRKMMTAAVLVLAACGNVEDQTPGMDVGSGGSGSDTGSGSDGMDGGMPARCATAADCGASQGCDTSTQTCVTETVMIDPGTDVVVDGTRWWTSVGDPILHGTYAGLPGAAVQAIVGSGPGTPATMAGNAWTVKLPSGSITGADTWVRFVLNDPSGGHTEVDQLFTLDTAAPQITLAASTLRDERGDTIDFSTGEPVHTHAGAEIDLASGACPSVYKYTYLADATAPSYGSAASPNPLTWNFTITDTKLDTSSAQLRIRNEANTTLVSWIPAPAADAAGVRHLTLTRNGGAYPLAAIGSAGKLYIDVKARDWNGLETTASWCFENHPLAAPLEVDSFEQGELFGMSLPADSPISQLINNGGQVGVLKQRIVQTTAEPITMTWSATTGDIQYTSTAFNDVVTESKNDGRLCSAGANVCTTSAAPTPSANPLATTTGTIPSGRLFAALRDESTGTIVTQGSSLALMYTIPARGPSEAPHVYRVLVISKQLSELQLPSLWDWMQEHVLMGLTYTGLTPADRGSTCSYIVQTAFGSACQLRNYWWGVSALDHVTLAFAALHASVGLSATTNGTPAPASYVPAANLATSSLTWDSGNDDLPGPF